MTYEEYCQGMKALEIGGPSGEFGTHGIYRSVGSVDGVNFSAETVWQHSQTEGKGQYKYADGKTGDLYICEGTDLHPIEDNSYDLILSSNNLEHIANPFKALTEWIRVVKPGGSIFLILPMKAHCFDHRRPTTTLQHLIDDYNDDVGEDDLTHLEEILKLHDLSKDQGAGTFLNFVNRSLKNIENRCLHHHVFDEQLIQQIFYQFDMEPVGFSEAYGHYLALAKVKK